jgi:hypothetical protein
MQHAARLRGDERAPLRVDVGQVAPRTDALLTQRQPVLLGGDPLGELEQRRRGWRGAGSRGRRHGCGGCGGLRRSRRGGSRGAASGVRRRCCGSSGDAAASVLVLRARGELRHQRLVGGELRGELLPLDGELIGAGQHVLPRPPQPAQFLAQRRPFTYLPDHALQCAEGARCLWRHARGGVLGRFVLLLHLLDTQVYVASAPHEVIVGFGDLVLFERDLRLGEVDAILQGGLVGLGCLGQRILQLLETRAVSGEPLLRLVESLLYGGGLRAEGRRMGLHMVQRCGERQIQLTVGGLHRLPGECLLLGSVGIARQALGDEQGVLIDDRQAVAAVANDHRRAGALHRCAARVVGGPKTVAGGEQQQPQHGGHDLLQLAHRPMMPRRGLG